MKYLFFFFFVLVLASLACGKIPTPEATQTPIYITVTPPPPTVEPYKYEELQYDMYDAGEDGVIDPIPVSSTVLSTGKDYLLTVSGTFSFWHPDSWNSVCGGVPEDAPFTLSPDIINGMVGVDVAYIFAYPCYGDTFNLPQSIAGFEVSVDNQLTWFSPTQLETQYSASHTYHYVVHGNGSPIAFRENDIPTNDNYGVMTIQIEGPVQAEALHTITVLADVAWFDTGIDIQEGQHLNFLASGSTNTWGGIPEATTDPDGWLDRLCPSAENKPTCLINDVPYGKLIGKIGQSEPFEVGTSLKILAHSSGRLYLASNDNAPYYDDNTGSYQVIIILPAQN